MSPDEVRAFLLHVTRTGKLGRPGVTVCRRGGGPLRDVHLRGRASVSEDLEEMRRWATLIGGRYMGEDRAEEFGQRNAVAGELLVWLTPERVIAQSCVAD